MTKTNMQLKVKRASAVLTATSGWLVSSNSSVLAAFFSLNEDNYCQLDLFYIVQKKLTKSSQAEWARTKNVAGQNISLILCRKSERKRVKVAESWTHFDFSAHEDLESVFFLFSLVSLQSKAQDVKWKTWTQPFTLINSCRAVSVGCDLIFTVKERL